MNFVQVQRTIEITALIELLILVLLVALSFWLTYVVIKNAIRDGIRESGLIGWQAAVTRMKAVNAEGRPEPTMDKE